MSRRYFCVEVERTVTYRRKVWVEVEENDERLKDEKRADGWSPIRAEAEDAAADKAKTSSLAGWETAETEYRAVASR